MMKSMDCRALDLVIDYAADKLNSYTARYEISAYIVWKCKILKNWKYLISTTMEDGMYYEVTFNGETNEWYVDAYEKISQRVVKEV